MAYDTLYLIVSGAATARRIPTLLTGLVRLAPIVITVLTPNAQRIVAPRELAMIPGHHLVESYFDDVSLPRPPRGVVLVAPCSFNTLNKVAGGIADNLALSIVAEAIGRRTPTIFAVSVNPPLWAHPRARNSVEIIRSWSSLVLDPSSIEDGLTLASDDEILAAAAHALTNG